MSFDVARVRGLYPTLGAGVTHLDGGYSALQPEAVIRAIIATLRASPTQPGSVSARSRRSAASLTGARRAIGDLVGTPADSVVLGGNVSTLLRRFADVLSREWMLGDEIVVSRLDHDANIRPWVAAAKGFGAVVRWAEVDVESGELPEWQYERLIGRTTRLVTVPLANPATGAIPDVRQIADLAHEFGALVVVDAGAAAAHLPIDLAAIGADLLAVSVATFGGPTLGAVAARPGLLREIDEGTADGRQRYEIGSIPVELLDGVTAAVDHLAGLDEAAAGPRRERLVASLSAARAYQEQLFPVLDARLRDVPGVTVLGMPKERVPVAAFAVEGYRPAQVGEFLAARGVSVWTGANGMSELMAALGADELGGTVHVGLMPHTTLAEVDQFIQALTELAKS